MSNRKLTGIEQLQEAKKKPKKIDKIVKGVFIYWITFVSLCFITFWIKGEEPVTLITYGLGGSAVELVITAVIEICRDKYNKNT
jgi:hypothetical protein